ncbi:MAG: L,D-transpeptidase family protein [Acidimicrobiia bacterium]
MDGVRMHVMNGGNHFVRRRHVVRRRRLAVAAAILAGVVGFAACRGDDNGSPTTAAGPAADDDGRSTTTTAVSSSTTSSSTTSTTEAPTTTTSTTTPGPPLVLPGTLTPISSTATVRPGDEGDQVVAIQQRLTALGYRPGPVDGVYSNSTASAVMAFQKSEGVGRDGTTGPDTLAQMLAPTGAGARDSGRAHIEIDLDRQIMFAVAGDGSATIINVSTGTGERYRDNGVSGVAITPTGGFVVERRIEGFHQAPLGTLYRPLFFYQGWAVHGSSNVPGYPASHGCVRTSNVDQDYLWDLYPNGSEVVIYSGDSDAPSVLTAPADAAPGA